MRNDDDGEDPAREIAELRAALQHEREQVQAERLRAKKWEREAVLRASTVAGSLTTRVLAAQRLALVVERSLAKLGGGSAEQEVRDALELFREVAEESANP